MRRFRQFATAGGTVVFDYESKLPPLGSLRNNPNAEVPGPAWLRKLIGDDFFRTPVTVLLFDGSNVTNELIEKHVAQLSKLQTLEFTSPTVTDEVLSHVARLHDLETLMIVCPKLTASGLRQLAPLKSLKILAVYRDIANEAFVLRLSRGVPAIGVGGECLLTDLFNDFLSFGPESVKLVIDPSVIGRNSPVATVQFKGESLRAILDRSLKGTGLAWTMKNRAILITSTESAPCRGRLRHATVDVSQCSRLSRRLVTNTRVPAARSCPWQIAVSETRCLRQSIMFERPLCLH